MTTLQLGDSGSEVSDLQNRLYQLGYDLNGGGIYDEYTEDAVRRFQSDHGLEPTGMADERTIDSLAQGSPNATDAASAEPRAPSDGNPAHVVDGNGTVLATGRAQLVNRQGALGELSATVREALEATFKSNIWTAPVPYAIDLANALGWTVALGIDGDAATDPSMGLTAGVGLYFGPNNEWGLYASIGADLGAIWGVSANACFTAVNGGSSTLGGPVWAIEGSVGDGLGGGLSFLFNMNGQFIGVAGEVGACAGIPASTYASYTDTWLLGLRIV